MGHGLGIGFGYYAYFSPGRQWRAFESLEEGAGTWEQWSTWFDGFRTLKLIHALRDQGLADRPYQDAFDAAPFVPERAEGTTLRETMARREAQLASLSR